MATLNRAETELAKGNQVLSQGNLAAAITHFERAASLAPGMWQAWANLCHVYRMAGRGADAVRAGQRSKTLKPDEPGIVLNLALAMAAAGQAPEALAEIRHLRQRDPRNLDYLQLEASLHLQTGAASLALELAEQALSQAQGAAPLWQLKGLALRALDRLPEALAALKRAHALMPNWGDPPANIASLYNEMEDFAAAEKTAREALARDRSSLTALVNLANALEALGRYDETLAVSQTLCSPEPLHPDAALSRIKALVHMGQSDEALDLAKKAIARWPDDERIKFSVAYAGLSVGNLTLGWPHYAHRYYSSDGRARQHAFSALPKWEGHACPPGQLIVWGDQGVGDELLFSVLLADVEERAPGTWVEVDARLAGLFARTYPALRFLDRKAARPPDFAPVHQCSLADLGGLFAKSLDRFAKAPRLLVTGDFETGLENAPTPHLRRIGISWRSGLRTGSRFLWYPPIQDLAPILRLPGVQIVNLQYEATAEELKELAVVAHPNSVFNPAFDLKNDLERLAKLNTQLDAIVAPSNAVGALGGAVGCPVCSFGIGPGDVDTLGTSNIPWFPSMTRFRREWNEPWPIVIAKVADHLSRTLNL